MALTKVQVPMKQELREKAQYVAEMYGYDSLQAAIRFLLTSFAQGRIVPTYSTGEDEWVTPAEDKVLRKKAKEALSDNKAGRNFTSNNFNELMGHLLGSDK